MKTLIDFAKNTTAPLIYFVRHAEKDVKKPVAHDADIPLTLAGEKQSVFFGEALRSRAESIGRILTSPLLRCTQTAALIQKGYQKKIKVIPSCLLGDPGAFVNDTFLAGKQFESHTVYEVVNQHLKTNELEGFERCEVATNYLLKQAEVEINEGNSSALFVSHDSVLCLLLGTLLGRAVSDDEWIDYLSGFILEKKPSQYILHWHHQSVDVTGHVNYILKENLQLELNDEKY